jgi:hypothetical protein
MNRIKLLTHINKQIKGNKKMITNLKESYKELREQLDDILLDYDVPKYNWHNMTWLNANIEGYVDITQFPRTFAKAIRLIHKLSPTPLNRLHSINYDE